ncbi:MAG: mucoidy inhibitor MuiA family protein [Candidatus Omnitrophica bacterium]|nr:mucoidy inhibitor MuiA family protein [Candidatus Omnitrophota bacterium]
MTRRAWCYVFMAAVCGFSSLSHAALPVELDSRINEVTVYPDAARITRTARVTLEPGEHVLEIRDIIPALDENSLKVSTTTAQSCRILGARVKKEHLSEVSAEAVRRIEQELQELEDEKKALENVRLALDDEKRFLDSFRFYTGDQLPRDMVSKLPEADKLAAVAGFLQKGLADYYARVEEVRIALRRIEKEINAVRRRLQEVSGGTRKVRRSVIVDLEVVQKGEIDLAVSYIVWGASWTPRYDARASFEKNTIEMAAFGVIRQKTGEDWRNVVLSLSTARPTRSGRMPYVSAWLLRPRDKVQGRMRKAVLSEAAAPLEQFAAFRDAEDKPREAGELESATLSEKGIAVVYTLRRAVTVKADNTGHKVPVFSQKLKADFAYSSYPRAAAYAYLGSRVKNGENAQLLPGKVSIFLDDDYVGTSRIDMIGPGEEFDLYLGLDENVKVKRERIRKKVDKTLIAGIPAQSTRTHFTYKLTVENYKSKKISVKLFEAFPVSEDDRIRVKISRVKKEPKEKDWDDRKGVWLWEFSLAPGARQEITCDFSVEHPRSMQVEGL